MIHIVYFSKGKLKGYSHPVAYTGPGADVFWKDMAIEGAKAPDNIVAPGEKFTAVIFKDDGTPTWMYESDVGMSKMMQITKASVDTPHKE